MKLADFLFIGFLAMVSRALLLWRDYFWPKKRKSIRELNYIKWLAWLCTGLVVSLVIMAVVGIGHIAWFVFALFTFCFLLVFGAMKSHKLKIELKKQLGNKNP